MSFARIEAATGRVLNVEVFEAPPSDTEAEIFRPLTGAAHIGWTWDGEEFTAPAAPPLEQRRAVKVAAARALFEAKVTAGWPFEGLHVEINDGSRANLGGLALTAFLASQEVATWPADYGRGWVSIEGTRIPLTPETAIPFAASAGAYYSALVQHEQDLEDALQAAESDAALAAVELTAGWPV